MKTNVIKTKRYKVNSASNTVIRKNRERQKEKWLIYLPVGNSFIN